jgi:hypothetical protein
LAGVAVNVIALGSVIVAIPETVQVFASETVTEYVLGDRPVLF